MTGKTKTTECKHEPIQEDWSEEGYTMRKVTCKNCNEVLSFDQVGPIY